MATIFIGIVAALMPQASQQEDVDFFSGRSPGLNSEQIAEGWISLFDGETLYGWRKESQADWTIKDGVIQVSKGDSGLLRTGVQFDDFELKLEFKCSNDTKAGVFIRSSPRPKTNSDDCIFINFDTPGINRVIFSDRESETVEENDGFNLLSIRAVGKSLLIHINGNLVSESSNDIFPTKGFIGLQHSSGKTQFRNIVVRPLKLKPIFNGQDLDGWSTEKRLDSEFSVDDGILRMKNGKGQIETVNQYADFIFSAHIKTNSAGLNSGVFFRCIPGDLMNGYESQIQNQFEDNDRTKPKDHGTGGIFRRLPARVVNANDEKWLAKTIIADGGTICVWVNGLLVADWNDKRKPHDNPRKGRRLKKGTIILQGHDPTTDLSFKQMQAREFNPRR